MQLLIHENCTIGTLWTTYEFVYPTASIYFQLFFEDDILYIPLSCHWTTDRNGIKLFGNLFYSLFVMTVHKNVEARLVSFN